MLRNREMQNLFDGLPKYKHPGKYEGEVALVEKIDSAKVDCDESLGSVEDFGWYGISRGAFDTPSPVLGELTDDETRFLRGIAGYIQHEDSQGFVEIEFYDDKADLDKAWSELEAEYERFESGGAE